MSRWLHFELTEFTGVFSVDSSAFGGFDYLFLKSQQGHMIRNRPSKWGLYVYMVFPASFKKVGIGTLAPAVWV